MGKVKFIIESDFLKTNSIMKFAIGKGAKIEDYQQTITEAKKDCVREFLTKIRDHCRDEAICNGCPMLHIDCNNMSKATDEDIQKVEG